MTDSDLNIVKNLLEQYAFVRGNIILLSGQHTTWHYDVKRVTLRPDGLYRLGQLLMRAILKYAPNADALAGYGLGGHSLVMAGVMNGLSGLLVGGYHVQGPEPPGKHAVIVDDVCTTGWSIKHTATVLRENGFIVTHAITVIERQAISLDLAVHPLFRTDEHGKLTAV